MIRVRAFALTMNVLLRSVSVLALFAAALAATASPIQYTFRTTGSGVLNGVGFTNAAVSIVGSADTAGVVPYGAGSRVQLLSTLVTVTGAGSDTLTSNFSAYAAPYDGGTAGIFNGTSFGNVFIAVTNPLFGSYDLATALGPVGSSHDSYNPGIDFGTTAGSFTLRSTSGTTFSAAPLPTPEPATLAALGLGAVALVKRRKK